LGMVGEGECRGGLLSEQDEYRKESRTEMDETEDAILCST